MMFTKTSAKTGENIHVASDDQTIFDDIVESIDREQFTQKMPQVLVTNERRVTLKDVALQPSHERKSSCCG